MTDATSNAASKPEESPGVLRVRRITQVVWCSFLLWWFVAGAHFLNIIVVVLAGILTAIIFMPDPRPMALVRILRDWLGVGLWVVGWGLSRSAADTLGMPVQEQIWIDVDRVLGFGETPVHRAQQLIDWDGPARLWEATLSIMYVSHFIVAFTVLIVMYNRDRVAWGQWWHRFVAVGTLGLIGYVLLPSVPPWLASDNGTVEMVYQGLPRGWDVIKVEWINRLFAFGKEQANPIAAMPSLHAAFPVSLYLFWGPRANRFMRGVMITYALYMGFVIVITGQHWLIDVFAGWLVAYMAHYMVCAAENWNARRKAAQTTELAAAGV